MGLFGRDKATKAELAELRALVEELSRPVDEIPLASGVIEALPTPGTSLEEVRQIAERAVATTNRTAASLSVLRTRQEAIDARMNEIAAAFTAQLGELSAEIDALAARPAATAIDDATIERLQAGQTRLANEQARYQMALRADLATLADSIRAASPRAAASS